MKESLERIGRFDPQRARDRFLSGFTPACTRHIYVDESCIGFVTVKPDNEGLLLDHLYITPEKQKGGIGTAVLKEIFKEADERGLSIRVGALKGSDSNRFYMRHGFQLVERGEWDNYYVRQARKAI
jgi:GNAT superfamily N-acetyltransferase